MITVTVNQNERAKKSSPVGSRPLRRCSLRVRSELEGRKA